MEHSLLTETEFFKHIGGANDLSHADMQVHYEQFVASAMTLCHSGRSVNATYVALAYTDTELSYIVRKAGSVVDTFVNKAQSFVHKMMEHLTNSSHHHTPHISNGNHCIEAPPAMRWTGNASDLVEVIYGFAESKSINNGETPVKEIARFFYDMLGVTAKDCYRIYADMKLRKNDSRTYFIDRMSELVNRRMEMDEERERRRR